MTPPEQAHDPLNPRLRIAQVAPLHEPVPPRLYGGTERVVAWLTEALVALGHEVTLFASGDSSTSARLEAGCPRALRLEGTNDAALAHHLVMLEGVRRRAREFDVIHNHIDLLGFSLGRGVASPVVTTLHGRLDIPCLTAVVAEFSEAPVVSISEAQRAPLPHARWVGTIHHGMPRDLYSFRSQPGDYLAFVGRISREKRLDRAVAIAEALNMPLIVGAKVDDADRKYFESEIAHLLDSPFVRFLGEIDDEGKAEIIGGARALLFPIDWPEPFGLVMIEAMACGTPVVAFRAGSVPEVIDHGVTGFVCDSLEEAIAATPRAIDLDRGRIRATFEARFTAERMAADYVATYRCLMTRSLAAAS
jgi:glycosyltransferase involved in cell wall biosynthesis